MAETFKYRTGAELPGLTLPWQEETAQNVWTDLDLSSDYTFTITLENISGGSDLSPTPDITGLNGSVTIDWVEDDLDTAGVYRLRLRARETATDRDRDYRPGNEPVIVIED